jgi:hypothetical protein
MQLDLFEQTETKAVKLNAKQQELFAVFQRSASDLTANEAAQIAKPKRHRSRSGGFSTRQCLRPTANAHTSLLRKG